MMQENIENINKNITNLAISGSHFGACCMIVSRGGAFFADLFFGTSAGTPKGDFGHRLEGCWPPWARLNRPFWNDVGIQRRFLVHPPFPRTCLSSETVGQIRKCYSNTSQTHDAIKAFNLSKSYIKIHYQY